MIYRMTHFVVKIQVFVTFEPEIFDDDMLFISIDF